MVYAKKSLGQHFLRSERALSSIRDASDPKGDDLILEIGPGEGVLTKILLTFAAKVIAVEKDDALHEELSGRFKDEIAQGKLDLIHGDILDFDPEVLRFYKDLTYKLVANIPYNITGAILEKFLSAEYEPERVVLLVQKEVAERIVTREKGRDDKESILSLSVKCYGKPKYVETVKAGSFTPAPKVDSSILLIENISKDFFNGFTEPEFFQMLHAGFSSKRKKLSSNLARIYPKDSVLQAFAKLGLDENARAEDVQLLTWGKLAQILCV
ncbi:16S rRNA (adenine(1518)-N(6)/adenine(1519)-N(6))-dimethyltransferase RsmA [Candidatus Parcubacteria bacterium]|nr:16S rRNA (adenine(1518)-N(6)/adenine(1519)-N(6))-dimethyltransferase RsmA [Candidatus Parcubacteria bacterium]